MTEPLIIVGCGGFGREVFTIIEALRAVGERWEVEGFVDDSPRSADLSQVRALGTAVIGSVDGLARRSTPYSAVVAVGSPAARQRIETALSPSPVTYPRLVHPDSTVGQSTVLGPGAVVAPGARLSTNITVGAHVHIDQNVTIGHDSTIADFARLNPQACISGDVHIGATTLIGAGAIVLQGLTIGSGSTVGAGACVTRDVAGGSTVVGIPARNIRCTDAASGGRQC